MLTASLLATAVLLICRTSALDDGLARTPPMGYNPWNAFQEFFTQKEALDMIDKLVNTGLVEAGYTYFNLDDGWMRNPREEGQALKPNTTSFPGGVKEIADYAHAKGMKLGIYSSAGTNTCKSFPASLGFEVQDAKAWASWGVDLVKYDNCWSASSPQPIRERYEAMRDAIKKSGRPMVFAMCEWGLSEPWHYGSQVGHMWRTTKDISTGIEASWPGILENLDSTARLARHAGPGGWNDADMLEVGPPGNAKLTLSEQRAHFALWAIIKSPLIIGADLRVIKPSELKILKTTEVIAVNQDPLGVAGDLVGKAGPEEIWAAPLAGGGRAVALFNRQMAGEGMTRRDMTVHWHQIGYAANLQAQVRDLYKAKDLGEVSGSFTIAVPCHGVAMLRITPLIHSAANERWRPWPCEADAAHDSHGQWACPGSGLVRADSARAGVRQAPSYAGLLFAGFTGVLVGSALSFTPLIGMLRSWMLRHRPSYSPALATSHMGRES